MDLHLQLENHWLACMAAAGSGARVIRTAGGVVVLNPEVSGYAFNFMALRGAQPGRLAPALELGGALLAGGERPPAVFLSPAAGDMEPLAAELAALGWRRLLRQVVLVRNLEGPFPEAAADVSAVTSDEVDRWCRTLVEAYEVDPMTGAGVARAWGGMLTARGDGWWARGYIARVGGEAAGTGLIWARGEIAGLYCGAVLPHMRRRGIHRALMLRRLADAAAQGCRLTVLQTEAGSPVEHLCTLSLGFTAAYFRELWVPDGTGLFVSM